MGGLTAGSETPCWISMCKQRNKRPLEPHLTDVVGVSIYTITLATRMAEVSLSPLPAFLALPGKLTVPWNRWIISFHTYLLALGLEDVSDARKRSLLLHCLGIEGQHISRLRPADIC